jgi:hypothetical protein
VFHVENLEGDKDGSEKNGKQVKYLGLTSLGLLGVRKLN